jgi:hypothetical protein
MMQISYQKFPDKKEYQSLLVINEEQRWRESLYFTFHKPWDEKEERLYAGRAMADLHFKNKPVACVLAFDFHRWDEETIKRALEMELPATAFDRPIEELLRLCLKERGSQPEGFTLKLKK